MCFKAVKKLFKSPKAPKIEKGPSAADLEREREAVAKREAVKAEEQAAAAFSRRKQNSVFTGSLGVPNRYKL